MELPDIQHLTLATGIAGVSLAVLLFIQYFVFRRLSDNHHPLILVLRKTHTIFLLIVSIYFGTLALDFPPEITLIAWRLFVAALAIQAGLWGNEIIFFFITKSKLFGNDNASLVGSVSIIKFLVRTALWAVIAIFLLGNWGFDITALVAGLGIGGIAVALAVQNVLGDLFASLSIVVDKPFTIGDFIIVDDYKGFVEHIGLKTTRMRSISGEQLIFSNADLLKSRVRNYKRMKRRRHSFPLGIVMSTSPEKLRQIPGIIKAIIEENDAVTFERCHFKEIGDFSYNYEAVYWIEKPDMGLFLDLQQQINLRILEKFAQEQIEFAYPTSTRILKEA